MCGIAGVFYPSSGETPSLELLQRMTATLLHRGPDEGTCHIDESVGLGHRRLRIIDLEGGQQPIFNEDGTKAIVFNGEIYNFRELRKELLSKGHRFRTQSDTEVIIHAYEEYGEDCVQHLRGMFAFAIWNRETTELFLARDRIGIKPLYYYWDGKKFLFASELKSILQDPTISRRIDVCALDDYLTYLYIPAPKTIFQGIRKLLPGHTLTVSEKGVKEQQYWDLVFGALTNLNEADSSAELLKKLRESIALHLVSEVPLGAFLSGGIDSSAVVGIMTEMLDKPVRTASIGFREIGSDELAYARIVAEHFHTKTHEKTVEASAARILDALVWHFDEPFADSSMVPTYYVSQVAREQVTVCLSGDGGDENFAGYRRYRFDVLENRIRAVLPQPLRAPLFGLLGQVYPKADWLPRVFRAKAFLTNLSCSPERGYFQSVSRFSPEMRQLLYRDQLKKSLGGYDSFSVMEDYFDRTRGWDPLSRVQYVDVKTYLVDDILTKVDRASMAHSLEVRVPLLDHEFMEAAARIPAAYKLKNGVGKYIFKKALEDLLPQPILRRRKMGFSIPLAEWFRGDLKGLFEDQVLASDASIVDLFDTSLISRWWKQHQRKTHDYSAHLWALLVFESWGRKFLQ